MNLIFITIKKILFPQKFWKKLKMILMKVGFLFNWIISDDSWLVDNIILHSKCKIVIQNYINITVTFAWIFLQDGSRFGPGNTIIIVINIKWCWALQCRISVSIDYTLSHVQVPATLQWDNNDLVAASEVVLIHSMLLQLNLETIINSLLKLISGSWRQSKYHFTLKNS